MQTLRTVEKRRRPNLAILQVNQPLENNTHSQPYP